MSAPLVLLDKITVQYGPHKALNEVSGSFGAGSLTAVAGPNGAGKSTLLKVIAGLLRPRKGSLFVAPEIRNRIGYLPQASALQRDFPLNVLQTASTGLWPEIGSSRSLSGPLIERTRQALAEVGLSDLEQRQIGALSGGQFQRLLFARLLLQDPALVLLDEPFAAVDSETTAKLIQLLLDWHRKGKTIICVLHDLLLIRKYFPESFVLAGKCMGRGHTHALFEQKLLSFDLDMAELIGQNESEEKGLDHRHV